MSQANSRPLLSGKVEGTSENSLLAIYNKYLLIQCVWGLLLKGTMYNTGFLLNFLERTPDNELQPSQHLRNTL